MYYLDKEIDLAIDFLNIEKRSFHVVTSIRVDYVNKVVNFELSSYRSEERFIENRTDAHVSFLDLSGCPNFSTDPILWILRVLISNEKSPFYRAEIKHNPDIEVI